MWLPPTKCVAFHVLFVSQSNVNCTTKKHNTHTAHGYMDWLEIAAEERRSMDFSRLHRNFVYRFDTMPCYFWHQMLFFRYLLLLVLLLCFLVAFAQQHTVNPSKKKFNSLLRGPHVYAFSIVIYKRFSIASDSHDCCTLRANQCTKIWTKIQFLWCVRQVFGGFNAALHPKVRCVQVY